MNVVEQLKISKVTSIATGFVITLSFLAVVPMVFQHAYSIPLPANSHFKIEKVFSASIKPSTMAFVGRDDSVSYNELEEI